MLTLDQLLTPPTLDQARSTMITVLSSVGFRNAVSWQSGSLPRALGIEIPAYLYVRACQLVTLVAYGGYNDTAQGDWLSLLSLSHYDNLRNEAQRARGFAVLTSTSPSAPPFDITPDYVVIADRLSGATFRNKTAGVLAPGGSLTLEFECEVAGDAGNSLAGNVTEMRTALAGVTVTNPPLSGLTTWLTRYGAEEEQDEALRTRNRTKWATLAVSAPEDAYIFWATEADAAITRAYVDSENPFGPNTVAIYIAGKTGTLPESLCEKVVAYVNGDIDGRARRGIGAIVSCLPARELEVSIGGTVYILSSYASTAIDAVKAAVVAFGQSLPVGGVKVKSDQGKVLFSALYMAVMKVPGVVNVGFTQPIADIEVANDEVVVLYPGFLFELVT